MGDAEADPGGTGPGHEGVRDEIVVPLFHPDPVSATRDPVARDRVVAARPQRDARAVAEDAVVTNAEARAALHQQGLVTVVGYDVPLYQAVGRADRLDADVG